jgi:branched-chain amino acid transport system permease protein
MQNFLQILVSGISIGMIYGVIAFGYQLTFATSKTLNFGQGEALTLGALVGFSAVTFLIGMGLGPFWAFLVALPVVFAFGLTQGAIVEGGSWPPSRSASSLRTSPKTSGAKTP